MVYSSHILSQKSNIPITFYCDFYHILKREIYTAINMPKLSARHNKKYPLKTRCFNPRTPNVIVQMVTFLLHSNFIYTLIRLSKNQPDVKIAN